MPSCYVISYPGQLNLLSSNEMENEYRPNCGDALQLESKGRHGSFRFVDKRACEWQVKLCHPSLTRAVPECFRDEYHDCKRYTNLHVHFTLLSYLSLISQPVSGKRSQIRIYSEALCLAPVKNSQKLTKNRQIHIPNTRSEDIRLNLRREKDWPCFKSLNYVARL